MVLLVTMFYAGSKYMDSQDITTFSKAKDFIFNGKNFSNITTQFMPTFKYYDWNVNHKLVHLQQWGGAACDATQNFEEVTSIFKWPGTKKGCL